MGIMPPIVHPLRSSLRFLPTCLWGGVILWLSLLESPPQVPSWLGWDKLEHAAAYGLLTWLLGAALMFRSARRRWLAAVVCSGCYGLLVEVLQGWLTAHRDASLADALANFIGASLAVPLLNYFHRDSYRP